MNFDITSLLDLIESRKTIRSYNDVMIDNEIIVQILEAAKWSPSAQNSQPWEFIIVKDKEKIKEISKTAKHAPILANAPLLIAVVKNMEHEDPWLASQLAYEQSVSCAGMLMLLAIHELGLGGIWANVDRAQTARILGVPLDKCDVPYVIACGYVDTDKEARLYFKTPEEQRRKDVLKSTYLDIYGNKVELI